jgi:SAM-dependent methyltransferase
MKATLSDVALNSIGLPAIIALGRSLLASGYQFVTPTPLTHARVLARPSTRGGLGLTDIFGWSRPFLRADLPPQYVDQLEAGRLLEQVGDKFRSLVRFSTLGPLLFAHSAYPTEDADSVFFGPDTYRFVRAIQTVVASRPDFAPQYVVDLGSGSGAGGIYCASLLPTIRRTTLVDISEKAVAFGKANAEINRIDAASLRSDLLSQVEDTADFIISNPPYLVDRRHRLYRDGGGQWGCDLAVRIVTESLERLSPDGCLLLYTGTPVVGGRDIFRSAVAPILAARTTAYRYEEIDPDVFGEELENAPYERADRIATVMLFVEAWNIRR